MSYNSFPANWRICLAYACQVDTLLMKEIELFQLWKNNISKTSVLTFVLLLLAADCAFIFMHVLLATQVLDVPLLSLEKDRGYSEIYQYIKEFWIVLLLMMLLTKKQGGWLRCVGRGFCLCSIR